MLRRCGQHWQSHPGSGAGRITLTSYACVCFGAIRIWRPRITSEAPTNNFPILMSIKLNRVNMTGVRRVAVGVMLATIASACGDAPKPPATDTTVPSGANGGMLVVALPQDVRSLYPPTVGRALDFAIVHSIYDRLAEIGTNLNTLGDSGFVPQLAETWKWAPDSLSIAFKLNAKARFHDGHPVRAEDVKFTFRAYSDPAGRSQYTSYLSNIDSVSTPDSLTAVVWYKRRTPQQFFDATYTMYVLPAHRLSGIPIGDLGTDSITKSPIGSGRFRFVSHIPGQRIEMISDTSNYRGRAKLDRVVWAVYANFQGATLSVFNGDADFFEKLQPEDLEKAAQNRNLKIVPYVQAGFTFLTFNLRAPLDHNKPHPIFGDVRVRRALTLAVDRATTARSVLDTFAVVSFGPAPRMMFQNPEALKQLPFDPAHARALLDSAGWLLSAGKDARSKDGVPLTFDIVLPSTSNPRIRYAEYLLQQFRGVGATVNVRVLEGSVMGDMLSGGKFDAYLGALTSTPGLKGLPQAWGSRGVNGQNYGAYSNAKFDADIDAALNALKPGAAEPFWQRAFQQIIDDAPAIYLYEERQIGIMHVRIQPQRMRTDAWYSDLADWSIDPTQRIARDKQSGLAR